MTMFEYESSDNAISKDALFLERLDTFMDKCLIDIKAFAERELRPYQETRRYIAQWHAKYLFQSSKPSLSSSSTITPDRTSQVRDILCDTSRVLESLSEVAGVQSFILAVDPLETSDHGFLGGSVVGREFWRGLRSGGEGGARAFKSYSLQHQHQHASRNMHIPELSTPPPTAKSLKNELYESVRNALRSASGVRGAEMKWTNPERLDVYGVRLIGWPEGVPAQNPSHFKVSQNKVLLEALQNGSMRFEKITPANPRQEEASKANEDDPHEDFSWAYDADASPPSSYAECSTTLPHSPPRQSLSTNQSSVLPVLVDEAESGNSMIWPSVLDTESTLSQYNILWADEWNEPSANQLEWDDESETSRPRKRPRSAEPYS